MPLFPPASSGSGIDVTVSGSAPYVGMTGLDIEPGTAVTLDHNESPTGTAQITINAVPEAIGIPYDNTTVGVLASNSVQNAIDELATKITVGTTAPASPNINDLWVDTN